MHPLFHPLFIHYCTYFNGNQDYFECHEVLEEYWKEIAPGQKNHPLVGYIQLATGLYHWRRKNLVGAKRMLKKAYANFLCNDPSTFFEYIDFQQLCHDCEKSIVAIERRLPFQSFPLLFSNPLFHSIIELYMDMLPTVHVDFLLNKHMLRDRTDILEARRQKKCAPRKN